jgi:hypothetical protein
LTEEKLSCSKCPGGILEIPIQGLTYSGAIDPRDESVGYVICLHSDKELESVEKRAAAHYHETSLGLLLKDREFYLAGRLVLTSLKLLHQSLGVMVADPKWLLLPQRRVKNVMLS